MVCGCGKIQAPTEEDWGGIGVLRQHPNTWFRTWEGVVYNGRKVPEKQ